MSFGEFLEARFARCVTRLGLSEAAAASLRALVRLDADPGTAVQDTHGRQGVLGWDRLFSVLLESGFSEADAEQGVHALAQWRLVQVVGREVGDPVVSGPAAVRLTPEGRACVGLAPMPGGADPQAEEAPEFGWVVLHGASRERLLSAAAEEVGDMAWQPVIAVPAGEAVARLPGRVAMSLCASGAVVIDGTGLTEADRVTVVPQLLARTRGGSGKRLLLLPNPTAARTAAIEGRVRLKWVEPRASESAADLDATVSERLLAALETSLADVCGVPGSGIALPKRVDIGFDDIVVPESVQLQMEQVRLHARFRLEVLPTRTHFKGRGRGYRLLLSGLPGTGKSMTAEALATSLGRSLVKLELSAVLSKWLGETEQLIGKVFDMAEAAGSVLVLDEAESLFRQRQSGPQGASALSTAVAYLLTRLERYQGVLVATTNRTQDVDEAFFRRFNDYVILPMPDSLARRELWTRMLQCGLDRDIEALGIDLDLLSERFTVSGGLINGAAIRANAWADGQGEQLNMPLVLAALGRELEKSDRSSKEVYLRPYSDDVARILARGA